MTIEVGQRYREAALGLFGRRGYEFIVLDLFVATDRLHYARVAMAHDPSMRKTIAAAVLADRRRYVLVAGPPEISLAIGSGEAPGSIGNSETSPST